MNAYKVEAVLAEDGTLVLQGLPFQAGAAVEVIILERPGLQQEQIATSGSEANPYPLLGKQPYRYDDPFEPAVPLEDWEALQ